MLLLSRRSTPTVLPSSVIAGDICPDKVSLNQIVRRPVVQQHSDRITRNKVARGGRRAADKIVRH